MCVNDIAVTPRKVWSLTAVLSNLVRGFLDKGRNFLDHSVYKNDLECDLVI